MRLFGTDGVRGKAGEKIDAFLAMKLAMAAGTYFRKTSKTNKILVGKDTRRSGYMIENALVAGFTAVGYNVIQIGPMPTPTIAFLTEDMRCDAGIMLSASHNPFYDNGIKFFDSKGNKLNEDIEKEIEEIFYSKDFSMAIEKEIGKSKRIDDVIGRYIVHIKQSFPKELSLNGIRIVIDSANGAAYKVAPTIFNELGADVISLADSPNGFNINEGCGAMHPEKLANAVREYRADIGFALDGDADRLVAVDEKGEIIDGDKLIASLALYLKSKNKLKNNGVAVTVMTNKAFEDHLNSHGIKTYQTQVGDKHILESLKENDLNFGGEQSGHIIFNDFAKTGDGLVSALQAMALLIESGKKSSELFDPFELYPQVQSHVMVEEKPPIIEIEGAMELLDSIEKDGFRHLVRYSGTENKLRLLVEGKDIKKARKHLENLQEFFKGKLS
jgi:phosphoglucosamine mutase